MRFLPAGVFDSITVLPERQVIHAPPCGDNPTKVLHS